MSPGGFAALLAQLRRRLAHRRENTVPTITRFLEMTPPSCRKPVQRSRIAVKTAGLAVLIFKNSASPGLRSCQPIETAASARLHLRVLKHLNQHDAEKVKI
jgi:hypothetical protein